MRIIGDMPKSESGPISLGQFSDGLFVSQPTSQASLGVCCTAQRGLPVARSSAMMASVFIELTGRLYASPVPMYITPRASSIVGVSQIPAPDGAYSCTPREFFFVGLGSSLRMCVFQTCLPVSASSATTLPRKVQQG